MSKKNPANRHAWLSLPSRLRAGMALMTMVGAGGGVWAQYDPTECVTILPVASGAGSNESPLLPCGTDGWGRGASYCSDVGAPSVAPKVPEEPA